MDARPADWVEPGDPADPKLATKRIVHLVVGLLAFAGAILAFYFLVFYGGLLFGIGLLFEVITELGQPAKGQDGSGSMLFLPALMVISGLCLAVGLLDIAFRTFMGKPYPSRSTVLRFCLISLTLAAATMVAVGLLHFSGR